MRPSIHSKKHIVQYPFSQITTGTREQILLVEAKNVSGVAAADEVVEGSQVKAVFIELWLQNSANDGHQIVTVTKVMDAGNGPSFAEMASLEDYNNKKNVLFIHEGLSSNDGVGNPQAVLRQWIKIPKGKQRFGLGDRLYLSISNPSSNNLNRCGVTVFKEYS